MLAAFVRTLQSWRPMCFQTRPTSARLHSYELEDCLLHPTIPPRTLSTDLTTCSLCLLTRSPKNPNRPRRRPWRNIPKPGRLCSRACSSNHRLRLTIMITLLRPFLTSLVRNLPQPYRKTTRGSSAHHPLGLGMALPRSSHHSLEPNRSAPPRWAAIRILTTWRDRNQCKSKHTGAIGSRS